MMKDCADLDKWESPVTGYPPLTHGAVQLRKRRIKAGSYFFAEGVRGFLFYHPTKSISFTELLISGKVWMVDSPEYVWSLESFAERAHGKVLVAGLGLGIVVHQLVKNPKVTDITVVEINADVIAAVECFLPRDKRIHIVHDDFYKFIKTDRKQRDTVIWDLAVLSPDDSINLGELLTIHPVAKQKYGDEVAVFAHGYDRDPVGEKFVREQHQRFKEVKEAVCGGSRFRRGRS